MARKLRVQFDGAIYHVTARGVEQRVIFDDDKDREHFIKRLGEAVEVTGVRLYLFCLMSNHFHFLIETPKGNLSTFMHKIQTAHTVYYNLRHDRAGHLLQGRFSVKLVQGDEYLYGLSRYIHLNPVYVGRNQKKPLKDRISILKGYKWSSYQGYSGICEKYDFVEENPILSMHTGVEREKRTAYRRFVESCVAKSDKEFKKVLEESEWGIGDEGVRGRIRDMHTEMVRHVRRAEDVALRRIDFDVKPEALMKIVADELGVEEESLKCRSYGNMSRAIAARMLIKYSGMNQRDVGGYLRIGTGAAVCQQLGVLRKYMESDKKLSGQVARIEGLLEKQAKQHS